jgi:cell division septum initiation protein DivIVA
MHMSDKATNTVPAAKTSPVKPVENTTDATRGEPLAVRAQKRKLELERALDKLPAEDARARNDINVAVSSISALLTGDVDHLSDTTAAELSRVLESSKHLAEVNPTPRSR